MLANRMMMGAAGVAQPCIYTDECTTLTGWTDSDLTNGVTSQETFDGKSTFKMDTNTHNVGGNYCHQYKTIGSFDGFGDRIVATCHVYFDLIGTLANNDHAKFIIQRSDWRFGVIFASDGVYIYDGAAYNTIGNFVVLDTWQLWQFDIDLSSGVANATVDSYLDSVSKATGKDCSYDGGSTDGRVELQQRGYTSDDQIMYWDYVRFGTDLGCV